MTTQPADGNLDKYGCVGVVSTLVRYGLFIGAIIQLICIGASILLPSSSESLTDEAGEEQKAGSDGVANARRQHKLRKLEKKKRR